MLVFGGVLGCTSTLLCKEMIEIRSCLKEEEVVGVPDWKGNLHHFSLEPFESCVVCMCYLFQKCLRKTKQQFEKSHVVLLSSGQGMGYRQGLALQGYKFGVSTLWKTSA